MLKRQQNPLKLFFVFFFPLSPSSSLCDSKVTFSRSDSSASNAGAGFGIERLLEECRMAVCVKWKWEQSQTFSVWRLCVGCRLDSTIRFSVLYWPCLLNLNGWNALEKLYFSNERLIQLRLFDSLVRDLWREEVGEIFNISLFVTGTKTYRKLLLFCRGAQVSHRLEQANESLYENGWCAHWRPTSNETKHKIQMPKLTIFCVYALHLSGQRSIYKCLRMTLFISDFFLYVYGVWMGDNNNAPAYALLPFENLKFCQSFRSSVGQ